MKKSFNINEACKLAKNLENWKNTLSYLLNDRNYTYKTTEVHLKKASNPEAEDETKTSEEKNQKQYDITVDEIIKLIRVLIEEKGKISRAIEDVKHSIAIDVNGVDLTLDPAIEYNKGLRNFIYSLSSLNRAKDTNSESQGRDYKLDNEGKQTPYYYTVKSTCEITFNKEESKQLEKELKRLADRVSVDIDKAKINTLVEIETEYDINDTLEDVISRFKEEVE